VGALVLAAAHLHAGGAHPAVPARCCGDPRLAGAAEWCRATGGLGLPFAQPRAVRVVRPAGAVRRLYRALVRRDLPGAAGLAAGLHHSARRAALEGTAWPAATGTSAAGADAGVPNR